ncbi:PDZ-binding protein [Blastocladiella britannica]|nr:PDZ-binding protein [Blastocladiella britannica]
MVCNKCAKKQAALITPEVWKEGKAGSSAKDRVAASKSKFLGKKDSRANPYASSCSECKQTVHQKNAKMCSSCAYKKGACAMCGVKVLDVSAYKQSSK